MSRPPWAEPMPSETSLGDAAARPGARTDPTPTAAPPSAPWIVPAQHDDRSAGPDQGEQTQAGASGQADLPGETSVRAVASAATAVTVPDGYENPVLRTLCRSTRGLAISWTMSTASTGAAAHARARRGRAAFQ